MARNGAGTYNLPTGQPVVTGTTISSSTFNALTTDLANALTGSISADGQTPITANLPMGGHKLTGLGAATGPGDGLRYENLAAIPGALLGVQIFTASGTYTPTAGTTSVIVEVQAPGGGGGGAAASGAGQFAQGAGGAAGGWGRKRITSAFSGVAVTIGAVGAAGVAGNSAGGTGGTTSFGALLSCTGGTGGTGGVLQTTAPSIVGSFPAAGGVPTGADCGQHGGQAGAPFALSTGVMVSPPGGDSMYGRGGHGAAITGGGGGANGVAGNDFGSGGSAGLTAGSSASTGGAGAPGIIIVWEYA